MTEELYHAVLSFMDDTISCLDHLNDTSDTSDLYDTIEYESICRSRESFEKCFNFNTGD